MTSFFSSLRERVQAVPIPTVVQRALSSASQRTHAATEGLRLVGVLASAAAGGIKEKFLPRSQTPEVPRILASSELVGADDGRGGFGLSVYGALLPGQALVLSLKGAAPEGITYQWQRGLAGQHYEAIEGATREIYYLTVFDIGCSMRLSVIKGPTVYDLDLGTVKRDEGQWKAVLALLANDEVVFSELLRVTDTSNEAARLRLTRKGVLMDGSPLLRYNVVGVFCAPEDGTRFLLKTKDSASTFVTKDQPQRDLFCLCFRTLRDDWMRRKALKAKIEGSGGLLGALAINQRDWPGATLGGGAVPTAAGASS